MSQVVAMSDISPDRVNQLGGTGKGAPGARCTIFLKGSADRPNDPTARINRYEPGKVRYSAAHYHEVDQFQVIIDGEGEFGRHHVSPYCVHFSRAYTAYGPLQSDKDKGWAFMVMRTRYDPGAHRFPEALDKLRKIPDRKPWQVTTKVSFPEAGSGVGLLDIPEISDDQGLFTKTLTMAPNAQTTAPDAVGGDGQHIMLVKGSLIHEGREREAPTVVFVKPDEPAFRIQAGAQGLQAIIMNFPRVAPRTVDAKTPSRAAGFRKWQCDLCAFAYDEALGMPEEGVAAGTRWEDVPETWSCPDCAASKSDFRMVEV